MCFFANHNIHGDIGRYCFQAHAGAMKNTHETINTLTMSLRKQSCR